MEGYNAGTNPGDGRVHIQDNPSATCAMKIRPLCESNVIICVPSTDCTVKVASKVLKMCSFVPGFLDTLTGNKWPGIEDIVFSIEPFCGFYTHLYIFSPPQQCWRIVSNAAKPECLLVKFLSVFYGDQEPQLSVLQVECCWQKKCGAQGTMNILWAPQAFSPWNC